MKLVVRVGLAGLLAAVPMVAFAPPASACEGVDCTVRCVHDLVVRGYCRL